MGMDRMVDWGIQWDEKGKEAYTIIHHVNNSPFLYRVCDLEKLLVHLHTCWFCVVAEAETHDAGFFAQLCFFVSLIVG
jgi:hypothetical protein